MDHLDRIKRALEARANTWEQGKELLDSVDGEGRDMSAEENETWDRINADLTDQDKRIAELEDLRARAAKADEVRARMGDVPTPESRETDDDADVLRKLAVGEIRSADFAFDTETRDITTTGASGAVPTGFLPRMWEYLTENAAIVGAGATQLRTAGGESMTVPRATAHPAASLIAEAGTITESDPTISSVTLDAYKYAFITQVSSEFLADSGIDIVEYLARQGGVALGNGFGAHVATGTGTAQPNGVVTASSLGTTGGTGNAGAPQETELIDLQHSVIAPYRGKDSTGFVMSDTTLAGVRKLQDTNGAFIWQPSMQLGVPSMILGDKVVVDTNIADAALSAKSVLYGDLSAYFARFAGGVRIERSDDYAFNTDLVSFRFILRADGDLVDTNAVKHFVGAGT